ncbi:MAG: MCE family protein [Alistipes sp.]|nr:MCE family protein [Alistipes sp.]
MKKEVKIGIFAVAILLCSWAGVRFLSGLDVFSRNRTYYARYESANGIQIASPVMIHGVKVGQVSAITLEPGRDKSVELALTVQRKYAIPEDSQAKIASNGLLGGKVVELELGVSADALANKAEINTVESGDLMSMAGGELEDLKAKLNDVVSSVTATLDGINSLIEANQRNINGVMTHLDSMTGTLDDVLTGRKTELQDLVANLSKFSEALGRNDEKVDSLLLNLSTISGQFAEADVAGTLQATLERLNALLGEAAEGDGTVSKLLNDKELYDNLATASANLSSLLADLEANPKRYVHFSLFGRGSKAAEKEHAAAKAEQK